MRRGVEPPLSACVAPEAAEDPHRLKETKNYDVGNSSQDLAQRASAVDSNVPNGEHLRNHVPQQCETPLDGELQLDEFTLPSSSGSAVSVPEEGADATSEETAAAYQDDRSESPWTEVGADGSLTLESNGRAPGQSLVHGSQGTPAPTVTGSLPQWVPFPGVPFLPPKKPSNSGKAAAASRLPHPPWVWTGDDTPHVHHPQLQPPNQPLRHLLCGAIDGAFEAAIRLALSLCTTEPCACRQAGW